MVELLLGPDLAGRALCEHRAHSLKERHVVTEAQGLFVRHRQGERLRELAHGGETAVLAVVLLEDVFLGGGQDTEALLRRAGLPLGPVETVEEAAADFMLLEHDSNRLFLIERRPARATAFGVGRQGLLQLVSQTQVINDQPTRFVLEHPVDPSDRLHQPMRTHRLVHIHRMQTRCVKPGQPHVAHNHELEHVIRIAEAIRKRLAPWLGADVRLPSRGIGRRTCHYDLDRAFVIVVVPPAGTKPHELAE